MLEKMVKSRNKKGFTLMEMLIVIAIIAILIAIATPVMMGQLKKAKAVADGASLSSANSVAAVYLLENSIAKDKEDATATTDAIVKAATDAGVSDTSTLDGGKIGCAWVAGKTAYVFYYGESLAAGHTMAYYQAIAQGLSEDDAKTKDAAAKK